MEVVDGIKVHASVCHAKVVFHMPKYKYGVLTPGMFTPFSDKVSRIVFKLFRFHSLTDGSVRLPGTPAPYRGLLNLTLFQYSASSSS